MLSSEYVFLETDDRFLLSMQQCRVGLYILLRYRYAKQIQNSQALKENHMMLVVLSQHYSYL